MEAMQPRICIQPQSRRSPRCYITIIIRASSRVFQFQDSQHSFQDCMDYILPGLHWKRFTTPCRRQHHCSLHRVAFPYLTAYLQVFCLFISIFWPIRTCWLAGPCYVGRHNISISFIVDWRSSTTMRLNRLTKVNSSPLFLCLISTHTAR